MLPFVAHLNTRFLGNKFRSTHTLIRMQPQVSLGLDNGTALSLNSLMFTKPVSETDPELRGKDERCVLHGLCSLHAFAFVQKAREPYYF